MTEEVYIARAVPKDCSKMTSTELTSSTPPPNNEEVFHKVLESVSSGSTQLFKKLSPGGRAYFIREAERFLGSKDQSALEALYSVDYRRLPVDPLTFLTHTDYMGHMKCWKSWRPHFEEVCKPQSGVSELILTGAQGLGKTTFAMFCLAYKIYRLSCLRDPCAFYGLAPRTQIIFGLYAMTKAQIKTCGFYTLRDQLIDQSPYFRDVFPRIQTGKETATFDHGPHRFFIETASQRIHALGRALFAVVADELNYYDRGVKSAVQARELVQELSDRLASRFVEYGGDIPGIACFVSQTRTSSDFLENRIKQVGNQRGVKVVRGPRWFFNPKGYAHPDGYHDGDPVFRVFIGDEVNDPKLLDKVTRTVDGGFVITPLDVENESDLTPEQVLDVPVTHYDKHVGDIHSALRLIDDVPSSTFTPFFSRRDIVQAAFREELPFPLASQIVPCYEGSEFQIKDIFDYKAVTTIDGGVYKPIRHPDAPRYLSLDLAAGGGSNRDRAGIAMVHASAHYVTNREGREEDDAGVGEIEVFKDIEVDFYLALEGSAYGHPIDFRKIRKFIIWLRDIGFWIHQITADQWQSFDTLQRLREMGFNAERQSVDRTSKPYRVARQIINEGRMGIPYPIGCNPSTLGSVEEALRRVTLFQELTGLEHDVKKDKVDHRSRNPNGERGSKDISDAVVASSFMCLTDKVDPGRNPNKVTPGVSRRRQLNRYLGQVAQYL